MRVIIVDDKEQNLNLLERMLNSRGHDVICAANGEEALEEALRSPPDLIITDILMPVMDGYSLCRAWMEQDTLKEIPLIFYTATYTDPKDAELALQLGASRFVVKPMEPEPFLAIINDVLDEHAAGRLAKAESPPITETIFLKQYNESLIRKLEEKLIDVESINHRLVDEISMRREKEREANRLTAAIEHTGEAVIITDTEAHIQYVNPAFERITGYTPDEVLGQKPSIIKSERQPDAFYQAMWRKLLNKELWSGRLVNRRKDGTLFTAETNISPILNGEDEIVSYVSISNDITAQLVREEQYRQLQKMESVGRLAGGIAHDFNNILQVIVTFSQLLDNNLNDCVSGKTSADYETQLADVQEILKAANLAKALTKQLLTFSRLKPREFQITDLNRIISDGEQMLRKTISKSTQLRFDLTPNLHMVNADASQILQVAMNLIVNANDAMPEGGSITLSTQNIESGNEEFSNILSDPTGNYVSLSVADDGCGVDKEQVEHLFEPFYTTKHNGTGLGLSVVYEIIQEHGGSIKVRSTPGEGTAFTILLPAEEL